MTSEYIARISYGKDSLKMLEVIHSRGLPLDRITTTDVWATDTISANLPPMDEFKAMMDQRIWDLYHIEVEHLCARNKDGSKKTYEQMFYHVPVRKGTKRERKREFRPGTIVGFPDIWMPWCQKLKIVSEQNPGIPCPDFKLVQETQNRLCQDSLFQRAPHEAQRQKYRGVPWYYCGRA